MIYAFETVFRPSRKIQSNVHSSRFDVREKKQHIQQRCLHRWKVYTLVSATDIPNRMTISSPNFATETIDVTCVLYIYIYTVLRLFWAHEASVKIWIIITRLKFTAALNNVCHQPIRMVTNPPTPPTDTRIKSINDVTDVIHRPRISKVYWNTKQVFTFKKKSRLQTYGLPLPAHWSHGSVTKFQD